MLWSIACPFGRPMRLAWARRARRWLRLVTMVTCIMQTTCAVCLIWHVVGKRDAVGNVAVHPDALMSMQPSFHRCSRPRKKVCPSITFPLLSACLACESGNRCRGPPGLARCHPQVFVSLRGPSGGQLDLPVAGVLRWFEMVAFLASASAISGATSWPILLLRLTLLLYNVVGDPETSG